MAAFVAAGAAVVSVPGRSQEPRTQVACNGQRISAIQVRTMPPSYGGLFARSPALGRLATAVQATTQPRVIENLVMLRVGERCSILLRRETERRLRAQPFLSEASVAAFADGAGGVRVEVVTVDEPSMLGFVGVSSRAPVLRALGAGSSNLGGRAVSMLAGWRDAGPYRDLKQARYSNWQLFAAPVQMHLEAVQRPHGYDASGQVVYPFFTDVQRAAWRVAGGAGETPVTFRSPDRAPTSLGFRQQFVDAGAVARVGAPGRLAIVGGALSVERAAAADRPFFLTDTGRVADTAGVLPGRYPDFRSARVNLLLGYRQVNFLRVTGFDALAGAQDVRRGVQLGLAIGRGLPVEGALPGELFVAGTVYGGVGSPTSFAGLEVLAEGRRVSSSRDWENLLVSGRFGFYLRAHPRHTVTGSLEYGAGRRQWTPFQLALGEARGGVRGYEDAELGGGARLVARLEERWRVGNVRGTGDLGLALFAEAGRLWAGDVPYGVTTGYLPSVGLAVLAAVPPRSRRIWRLDIAFPLERTAGAQWGMRITNEDRTRSFWTEPRDLRRNRERSSLVTAFEVP